eukprot:scaffold14277_cov69-Cyclotella_meneghiniana.AAC.3
MSLNRSISSNSSMDSSIDSAMGFVSIKKLCLVEDLTNSAIKRGQEYITFPDPNYKPEFELLSQLSDILKTNPNVVYEKRDGWTLLHSAALHRPPEFCQLLIDANPNLVRTLNNDGELPVHVACLHVNVKTAKQLFELYPESINIPNRVGQSPLQAFCSYSYGPDQELFPGTLTFRMGGCPNIELAKLLLQLDQKGISKPSKDKCLPLHYASEIRSLAVTKLIFDEYPEAINIRNYEQYTPLDCARYKRGGHIADVIVAFLERQIRWESRAREDRTPDSKGNLPIHRVLKSEYTLVGTIKDSIEYVEAIRSLLEVNPVDILKCLLSKSNNTSNDDVEQSMLTHLSRLFMGP